MTTPELSPGSLFFAFYLEKILFFIGFYLFLCQKKIIIITVLWYDGLRNTGKHASEGDKKKMKKLTKSFLVMILGLLMSVNVMADVQTGKTGPDYPTDYYMIVESKAGGIDIYSQPDLESTRLNDEQIPNGTALHIEGEVEDTENNRTWGYTEYHGMYGYAPLDECRPADSRKEAIDSELYIAGKDHVNYNADYDVKADAEGGSQKLYQGPGTKYGEVPGVRDIENGETLHITQDAEMADGSHWGVTTVDGTEGWVDLEKTEEWKKEHPDTVEESVDAVAEVSVTPTEVAKATETPAPTETAKATETPAPTEAAEATETPTPAVTEEADEAENTEKDSKEPEAENSDTKDSREASGQNVKAAKTKWYQNPFTWIIGIAVLAVIGLLVYHNKKK